jgi:hypothetical protein
VDVRPSERARPRLVLHAGTLKTGTTSVQRALAENRSWLGVRGVIYPDTHPHLGGSAAAHFRLTSAFKGIDPALLEDAQSLLGSLAADAGSNTVVLSAEPVWLHRAGLAAWTPVSAHEHWHRRQAYLRSLADGLRGFTTEILVVLRRRDEFAESLYKEVVAKGFVSLPFEAFLDAFAPVFEYRRQVDAFAAAFPVVTVRSYHEKPAVETVCEAVGVPVPPGAEAVRERRSPDPRLTLWMLRRPPSERPLQRAFAWSAAGRGLFARERAGTLWTPEARAVFLARFDDGFEPIGRPDTARPTHTIGSLGRRDTVRIDAAYRRWQRDRRPMRARTRRQRRQDR